MKTLLGSLILGSAAFLFATGCGDFAPQVNQGPNNSGRIVLVGDGAGSSVTDGGVASTDSTTPPVYWDSGATPPRPDSAVPPTPDTGPTGSCGSPQESANFVLTNQARAAQGLAALTCDLKVAAVARAYSKTMCDRNHFNHTGPDGSSPSSRLRAGGVSFRGAGENIAYGYRDASAVHTGWMNSPGHKANILRSSYQKIGVGYYLCPRNGRAYWTQNFIQ